MCAAVREILLIVVKASARHDDGSSGEERASKEEPEDVVVTEQMNGRTAGELPVAAAVAAVERPWGFFQVLDESPAGYKVKSIQVNPGARLSLQSHRDRSEHWVIVAGQGMVWLDDSRLPVSDGDAVDIPAGARHRVECVGNRPLVFIEVQRGGYLGEDDIVRYDDDYGRA